MNIGNVTQCSEFLAGECGARPTDARTHTPPKMSVLGTLTKSEAIPQPRGLEQNAVARLEKYELQDASLTLLPNERVRFCLRHRISKDKGVGVKYNESRGKAHYDNVQRCGSVWTCPVCAAQISEGRRQELKKAMSTWRSQGGAVYLWTITNPHHHGDNLTQLLAGQTKAIKSFWGVRKVKEMFAALGKVGHIIATEVTHGVNGWHPHYHILLFFKKPISLKPLGNFLAVCWQEACIRAGLKVPTLEHGSDLKNGTYADQYISKWGLEDEVTKGHTKKGREGSATPWDLLRQFNDGCEKAGKLFQTFAAAFKGKRQLSWSRGLKALLLVDEVSDEELATQTDKDSVEVHELELELWRLIKRFKQRAQYLKAVEDDIKDDGFRASMLILALAERHTKENMHELMREADLHAVRYEALATLEV